MANVLQPDWDEEQDRPPFSWKRARLGRQAGGSALGDVRTRRCVASKFAAVCSAIKFTLIALALLYALCGLALWLRARRLQPSQAV